MFPSVLHNHAEKAVCPSALGWRKETGSLWAEPQCNKTRESPSDGLAQGPTPTMTHHASWPLPDATLPSLQGAQVCSQLSQALLHGDRADPGRQPEPSRVALILKLSVFCFTSDPRLFLRPFLWVCSFVWTFISKYSKNIYYILWCFLAIMMKSVLSATPKSVRCLHLSMTLRDPWLCLVPSQGLYLWPRHWLWYWLAKRKCPGVLKTRHHLVFFILLSLLQKGNTSGTYKRKANMLLPQIDMWPDCLCLKLPSTYIPETIESWNIKGP